MDSPDALTAAEWSALLKAVACGEVQVIVGTEAGSRVVLMAEQDLVSLEKAAMAHQAPVVLTARQREVLVAVEQGLAVAQVAVRLGIAVGTAVQHLAAARCKFGVRTSAEAAMRAREAGVLG